MRQTEKIDIPIIKLFTDCETKQSVYKKIIELSSLLPPFSEEKKTENNRITGCQSVTFISHVVEENTLIWSGYSDALITKGLLYLLITFYNRKTPLEVLQKNPDFLQELQIAESLSMNRANGLNHMIQFFKKTALMELKKSAV